MSTQIWWEAPQRYDDRPDSRKITWLELFYDLVYVAVIGRFSEYLQRHPDLHALGQMGVVFMLVMWSWINGSNYHDLHGNNGLRTRFFTLLQMLAVASMAITLPPVFSGQTAGFSLSVLAVQAIITYLWWSTGKYDPSHRPLSRPYIGCYLLGGLLFGAAWIWPQQRIWLWPLGLLSNYTPPFLAAEVLHSELRRRGRHLRNSAAMVERYGLFTIIVMCESLLGLINGTSRSDLAVQDWLKFGLGVLSLFCIWWIYFDLLGDRQLKDGYFEMIALNLLHIPLLFSLLLLASAGYRLMEAAAATEALWAHAVPLALILGMVLILNRLMEHQPHEQAQARAFSRLITPCIAYILALPWLGPSPTNYLLAVCGGLIVLILTTLARAQKAGPKPGRG